MVRLDFFFQLKKQTEFTQLQLRVLEKVVLLSFEKCQMGEPHGDESEQALFSFFFVFEGRTFDDVNKNEQYP
jgi:hypothetical protein